MKNIRWFMLGSFFFILQGLAWGGAPFLTDDPEPVDYQHMEIYVSGNYSRNSAGEAGTGQFELNYGGFPEVQLHIVLSGAFNAPIGQPTTSGTGDTELGAKIRLLKGTDDLSQLAVYPVVELPTGNASQGLGSGQVRFYLPLWLQKSWGPWTTYGGGGYWINPGDGNQNWIFLGWEIQRDLSKVFTIGGELFFRTPDTTDGLDSLGGNLGAIVNWDEHNHTLLSAGRDLVNPVNNLIGYAGYQWTF